MKGDIVYVKWIDASSSSNTNFYPGDIIPDCEMETIGFWVKETKDYIVVATDRCLTTGKFNVPSTIVKGSIKQLVNLDVPKVKTAKRAYRKRR